MDIPLHFESFAQPVFIRDIWRRLPILSARTKLNIAIEFSLLILGPPLVLIAIMIGTNALPNLFTGVFTAVYMLIGGFSLRTHLLFIADCIRFERFALANGFDTTIDTPAQNHVSSVFNGSKRILMALKTVSYPQIEIGNIQERLAHGERNKAYTFGYIRMQLPRALPHIFLTAASSSLLDSHTFSRSQHLELEGDFNKYFSLYVPKGYEADALYIFTPDVMEKFVYAAHALNKVSNSVLLDCEIIDDQLYLFSHSHFDLFDKTYLVTIFETIFLLGQKFNSQISRYHDDRSPANDTQVISAEGRRLDRTRFGLAILLMQSFGLCIVFIVAAIMIFHLTR